MSAAIIEKAPAKINLYLHVTGKRADGYHLLDSLVVFATQGDEACDILTLTPSSDFSLTFSGPYGTALSAEDVGNNLVTRVLEKAAAALHTTCPFHIHLEKRLPLASGIGGGSADAAAALRAAARLWDVPFDHPALLMAAASVGADIPACLFSTPLFFGGIGDEIARVASLPSLAMVLVNPGIPLPTAPVFKARQGDFTSLPRLQPMPQAGHDLVHALRGYRNDLEAPARSLCAAIDDVLASLHAAEGCLLARLSGSGATCFGLFDDAVKAEAAAHTLRRQIREWWIAVTGF